VSIACTIARKNGIGCVFGFRPARFWVCKAPGGASYGEWPAWNDSITNHGCGVAVRNASASSTVSVVAYVVDVVVVPFSTLGQL